MEQVEKVNTERKIAMAGRIEAALGGSVRDKTIGVLGVTFKPNTDDMREAPSLVIFPMLQARGARVRAYDPQVAPRHKSFAFRRGVGAKARWRRPKAPTCSSFDRVERISRARSPSA